MTAARVTVMLVLAALLAPICWSVYDFLSHSSLRSGSAASMDLDMQATAIAHEEVHIAAIDEQLNFPEPSSGAMGTPATAPLAPAPPPPPPTPTSPVDLGLWIGLSAACFAPVALGAGFLWRRASLRA